eukprot:5263551-Lingulodinium_polyedra.AAC.1
MHAVASFKGSLCDWIEAASVREKEQDEVRCWKALLVLDAFIFAEIKASEAGARCVRNAERLD